MQVIPPRSRPSPSPNLRDADVF